MILILMRHGIAEELESVPSGDDAARQLTPKGHKRAEAMAGSLRTQALVPTLVLTSRRTRAVQTAAAVLGTLTVEPATHVVDSMDLDGRWSELRADLSRVTKDAQGAIVLAVGHLPSIGDHLAGAIGLEGSFQGFKKGAVAVIEWENDDLKWPGELLLYLTPRYC